MAFAFRIKVNLAEGAAHGTQRFARRPERILIGGKLNHVMKPELALQLFNRLARFVRTYGPDITLVTLFHFVRHKKSL